MALNKSKGKTFKEADPTGFIKFSKDVKKDMRKYRRWLFWNRLLRRFGKNKRRR